MLHAPVRLVLESMCFVAYQGDDHAVEVEEEHDEVEAEFDEGFLERGGWLVSGVGFPDCLCSRDGPFCGRLICGISRLRRGDVGCRKSWLCHAISSTFSLRESRDGGHRAYFFALYASNGRFSINAIQYPLIRKSAVRKAWTPASGTM